jgi:hypothetical protein
MKSIKYFFLLAFLAVNIYSSESELFNLIRQENGNLTLQNTSAEIKDTPKSPTAVKYLLFNNFNLDALHPSFAQSAYIDPINQDPDLKSLFSFKTWDQTTLAVPITNYEIVVFPLGDIPINAIVNGVSPISKIRELIAAGKKIILTGRNILTFAFNAQSPMANAEIQKFMTDTLGINFIGKVAVSTTSGSTTSFKGYVNQGDFKDPIAYGTRIESNIKYKISNSGYEEPIAYYVSVDAFKSKNPDKYSKSYHFNDANGDTLLCTKTKLANGAKIVTWTVGYENFSLSAARLSAMQYCVSWLMEGEPTPGPNAEFPYSSIKFGNVPIGTSGEQILSFKNTGSVDLKVTDVYIDWDDDSVYKFVDLPTLPFYLKNGEAASIRVKFTPKENISYDAIIQVATNSDNSSEKIITVSGSGGTGSGPILITDLQNDKISYGQVVKGNKSIVTFSIKNDGNVDLDLTKITWARNDSVAFIIDQGSSYPWTIKPGEERVMKIRFVPSAENTIFFGQLDVENNGLGKSPYPIYMEGEGVKFTDVEETTPNFEFYPNPAREYVSIKSNSLSSEIHIALFDNEGKPVKIEENYISQNGIINLNISNLSSGSYYIRLIENGKTEFLPLMIVK